MALGGTVTGTVLALSSAVAHLSQSFEPKQTASLQLHLDQRFSLAPWHSFQRCNAHDQPKPKQDAASLRSAIHVTTFPSV